MGILVITPGIQTLIQDAGRPGYARLGVARSGAFDLVAWRRANRIAGNDLPKPQSEEAGPAALEVLIGGLEFITTADVTLAVSGAELTVAATSPTGESRELVRDTSHRIESGVTVTLSRATNGLRAYVAFQGGLDSPQVLGSRSYDTTAQLGPLPAVGGLELSIATHDPTEASELATRNASNALNEPSETQLEPPVAGRQPEEQPTSSYFELTPGPEVYLLHTKPESLTAVTWKISPSSSRAGIRLTPVSEQTPIASAASLPSAPALPGAIQAFPNGELVALGPDGPTTGGYPVLAIMSRHDLSRLSQIRPGTHVTLTQSSPAQ
jgi:biotin-dependent carboxylase-like uncharacterized protein